MTLTKAALKHWQHVAEATNSDLERTADGEGVILIPRQPWASDEPTIAPTRTRTIRLRVTPEEEGQLRQNATDAGMSVSEYIRQHTIGATNDDQ